MNEKKVLEELGLSNAESKIYLMLLDLGSTLVGPVIKKTGLHRATTYQIIQRLKQKGLVSSIIKGKKQYFEAAKPQRLMDVLEERKEHLQAILPKLNARLESNKEGQKVTVYSGLKGIRSVMDQMLTELHPKGKYYDFGASGLFHEFMPSYFETWQKRKRKSKIKSYVIFNELVKKKRPELITTYYGEAKFHPKEYTSFVDTMIYNDKVILYVWSAEPPFAIVIENRTTAHGYKNQFKLMWNFLKKGKKS